MGCRWYRCPLADPRSPAGFPTPVARPWIGQLFIGSGFGNRVRSSAEDDLAVYCGSTGGTGLGIELAINSSFELLAKLCERDSFWKDETTSLLI
jgi:hypothetical protein